MIVKVTSDALGDVQDSHAFYEKQTDGLGSYFRSCLEQDLVDLQHTAGIHSKIHGYHHVRSKVFQSILFYRTQAGIAIVMAVLDGRIDPSQRDRILLKRIGV